MSIADGNSLTSRVPWNMSLMQLAFCLGVSAMLRVEYLLAEKVVASLSRDWDKKKVRVFSVRVASLTHASIASILCVSSLVSDPNYLKDIFDYAKDSAKLVYLFSVGYYIYDLMDMYIHEEIWRSKEYLIHHTLTLTGIFIVLRTGKLYGFTMTGLLVEVQTVFLHLRTMSRVLRVWKRHVTVYSTVIKLNMVCLFLFRHIPTTYLFYGVLSDEDKLSSTMKRYLVSCLSFLFYHNAHLTVSMAKADGFFGYKGQHPDTATTADPLSPLKHRSRQDLSIFALHSADGLHSAKAIKCH